MTSVALDAVMAQARRLASSGQTLPEVAIHLHQTFPDTTAPHIAVALKGTVELLPLSFGDESALDGPINIAAALKAAGFKADDIAPALIAQGVYPDLTATQVAEVLRAPGVFPDLTKEETRAALAAAGFSSQAVDAAINAVFPQQPTFRTLGPVGSGGSPFDDWPTAQGLGSITALTVRSGNIVDSVQATYGAHALPRHGGGGGGPNLVGLDAGDVLVEISGFHGSWFGAETILEITLKTRRGETHGPFANMAFAGSRTAFSFKAEANEQIIALSGAARSAAQADGTPTQFLSQLGVTIQTG